MPSSTFMDALCQREALLDRREQKLDAREERIEKREAQLQQMFDRLLERENRLLARENNLLEQEANASGRIRALNELTSTKSVEGQGAQDSIHDVPRLLALYRLNGGVVPTSLLVAEVEALKQAATQFQDLAASKEAQIKELNQRLALSLSPFWADITNKSMEANAKEQEEALASMRSLMQSFATHRDVGIQRLVPNLLKTAKHFDFVFEEAVSREEHGEATLTHIGNVCAQTTTKGNMLRQPLPSSLPETSLHTMLLLLEQTVHAAPRLQRLAEKAIAGRPGCQVLPPPEITKSIPRALEKVQGEYGGDYTRLLDYCRTTIVCNTLLNLSEVLQWLCSSKAPGFKLCRIKDRISREGGYDPESSGGNRDVLLNGWLVTGMGSDLIVEIQIHLGVLFALKADLHLLYDGARILGSFDPAITSHEGTVSEKVIEKMELGVIRIVKCPHSRVTADQMQRIVQVVQSQPNSVRHLDFCYLDLDSSSPNEGVAESPIAGWTLERFFVPATGTLACTGLKFLDFACLGLVGPIPSALQRCRALQFLGLNSNMIDGVLPEWLPELPLLVLQIENTLIHGSVSVLSLCKRLLRVYLAGNELEGEINTDVVSVLGKLEMFRFGRTEPLGNQEPLGNEGHPRRTQHLKNLRTREGHGNTRLWITERNKAALCRLWIEESELEADRSKKRFGSTLSRHLESIDRPFELSYDDKLLWPSTRAN